MGWWGESGVHWAVLLRRTGVGGWRWGARGEGRVTPTALTGLHHRIECTSFRLKFVTLVLVPRCVHFRQLRSELFLRVAARGRHRLVWPARLLYYFTSRCLSLRSFLPATPARLISRRGLRCFRFKNVKRSAAFARPLDRFFPQATVCVFKRSNGLVIQTRVLRASFSPFKRAFCAPPSLAVSHR